MEGKGGYQKTKFEFTLGKKATIYHVTTMLATSKNVSFPGHNHLLTTGADDPTLYRPSATHRCWWSFTLIIMLAGARMIIKVSGH